MRIIESFLDRNKALGFPYFRNLLLVRFFIILSLNMQMTIVSYMVYQLTKNPMSLGLIGFWEVIPAIGFSLVSGYFVDQREKRNLMRNCILGYMFLSLFYTLLSTKGFQQAAGLDVTLNLVYAGVFLGGTLRAFISPSSFTLLGLLVPKTLYANATTWSSTAWQSGAVIGPLVGGMLLAAAGAEISLFGVFVAQIIAFTAVLFIPKQEVFKNVKEPILQSLKSGLQFVFSTPMILAALSLDMFAVLFGGAVALLPVYATDILKVGEVGYGWLRAAPGIGAVVTLMILSFIPLKTKAGLKLLFGIGMFGVTTIIFGISTSFILSFFMLLLGGMFDSVSVVIRGTILQLYTPNEMRGRVASVNTMFISSSNELGAMESGATARLMGTVPAVVFGGCMTILIVIFTYFKMPSLHTLKLEPSEKGKT